MTLSSQELTKTGVRDLIRGNNTSFEWLNHRNLYLLGLAVVLSGMGWSNFLMSLGQFILAGNWLLELAFKQKATLLYNNKIFWALLLPFLFLVLGLLWTSNFDYAMNDLRIKLPMILFPLFIATAKPLNKKEWRLLFAIYLISLFLLSFLSTLKLMQLEAHQISDKRELSIKISHIRYGLNLALASILSFNFINLYGKKFRVLMILFGTWFFACLVIFQLYTGLACFLVVALLFGFFKILKQEKTSIKLITLTLLSLSIFFIINELDKVKADFETKVELDYDQENLSTQKTLNGEIYWHNIKNDKKENGVYVERFIAWQEIEKEWNKRSSISLHGKDIKDQYLSYSVLRYLSSKGLKKDSLGISKLSNNEIKAIESGVANVYFENNPIKSRIHAIFYELDNYQKTGYANGYSLAMRIEYWKTAWSIVKKNPIIGVGTGDVPNAFEAQYEEDNSLLADVYRKRAHNQYLTFGTALGALGFIVFGISLCYPLSVFQTKYKMAYVAFFIITCISFLTEDTLETQAGVTFYAFFNALFLFGHKSNQDHID